MWRQTCMHISRKEDLGCIQLCSSNLRKIMRNEKRPHLHVHLSNRILQWKLMKWIQYRCMHMYIHMPFHPSLVEYKMVSQKWLDCTNHKKWCSYNYVQCKYMYMKCVRLTCACRSWSRPLTTGLTGDTALLCQHIPYVTDIGYHGTKRGGGHCGWGSSITWHGRIATVYDWREDEMKRVWNSTNV